MQQLGDLFVAQIAAKPKGDQGSVPAGQPGNLVEKLAVADAPQS